MKRYLEYLAESKTPQSGYINEAKRPSYDERWWDAIRNNKLNKIRKLMELGYDVNSKNSGGGTALVFAASNGMIDLFKLLLTNPNININEKTYKRGSTAIIFAIIRSQIDMINILLARPELDINIQDGDGETPLIRSAMHNDINITKLILSHPDVDINIKDNEGKTFVDYISMDELNDYDFQMKLVKNEREDILLLLNKYGVLDQRIKKENPNLFKAANWGLISEHKQETIELWFNAILDDNISVVKELIRKGFDVNYHDIKSSKYFYPGIIRAIYGWRTEIIKLLLEQPNIDIEIGDNMDETLIDVIKRYYSGLLFLRDYDMQKKIIDNQRYDILSMLDKEGLIDSDIKKENPELFAAKDWGLIL